MDDELTYTDDNTPLLIEHDAKYRASWQNKGNIISQRRIIENEYGYGDQLFQSPDENTKDDDYDDRIVSIFVVAFDTKAGNILEWSVPSDLQMDGLEFKALTSGSHNMKTDFVYFRMGKLFGYACFENMSVDNQSERGARMRSVGIMATNYTTLHKHAHFLRKQVQFLNSGENIIKENFLIPDLVPLDHLLEYQGSYESLFEYWTQKKATLKGGLKLDEELGISNNLTSLNNGCETDTDSADGSRVDHPSKCFSEFLDYFGAKTLILWKLALLGKRILFYSTPPIGVVCHRVYSTCWMTKHNMVSQLGQNVCPNLKPYFYVNVADIDQLESESSYVACTTEKIFETKSNLYDVYLDERNSGQQSSCSSQKSNLKDILKINSADNLKYEKLLELNIQYEGEESYSSLKSGEWFTSYFRQLNNKLLKGLVDASYSDDNQLTSNRIKELGLDPVADRTFLMAVLETYAIDAMLVLDNPCCPT